MIILPSGYILLVFGLATIFLGILVMLGPKALKKSERTPRTKEEKESDLIMGIVLFGIGALVFLGWLIFRI